MRAAEPAAAPPDLLRRLPRLVLIERICAYLTPRELDRLAGVCRRTHRLLRSGLCAELLGRQRLRAELLWLKARFTDRVRVTISERSGEAATRPDAASRPRSASPAPDAAPESRDSQSRLLRAKDAEVGELRSEVARHQLRARTLAQEVVRLRSELAAVNAAKARCVDTLEAISRACE